MKLLGREISAGALVSRIEERLRARGISASFTLRPEEIDPEAAVDPWSFYLQALETTADAARPLPLPPDSPRLVRLARGALRTALQPVARELLARQTEFNGHTRDSYAHLAAELKRLRAEVEVLRAERVAPELPKAPVLERGAPAPSVPTKARSKAAPASKPPAQTPSTKNAPAGAAPRSASKKAASKRPAGPSAPESTARMPPGKRGRPAPRGSRR